MCAIMGLLDVKNVFTTKNKNILMRQLATVSECRGTDATGFAYNLNGSINIVKRAVAARKMKLSLPNGIKAVIGHTRLTTQGDEVYNYNNHPFMGRVHDAQFALVHNGMLHNDATLRKQYKLPATRIETDSYVAVQLIEHMQQLNFESLKFMAEAVSGMFTFAVLDNHDNIWIIKGDNPVCLYRSIDHGFYIFASTKEILDAALKNVGLDKLKFEEIKMISGEVMKIAANGSMKREQFDCDYLWYDDMDAPALKEMAHQFGIYEDEIDLLIEFGYAPEEIELMLNNRYEIYQALYEDIGGLCYEKY